MSTVVDFAGTGDILTSQGSISVVTDQDALVNAVNLWICSFRSERLYRPKAGGVIAPALLKPMSDERAKDMETRLRQGLQYEFNPSLSVQECVVKADFENNTYWIRIKGYCPALQVSIYDEMGVKPLV